MSILRGRKLAAFLSELFCFLLQATLERKEELRIAGCALRKVGGGKKSLLGLIEKFRHSPPHLIEFRGPAPLQLSKE
jgi:hypothetical protein